MTAPLCLCKGEFVFGGTVEEVWIGTAYQPVFARAAGPAAGPLALGIHGWSQRNGAHTWAPFLPPLAQAGCRALSLDMPGWGRSERWAQGPAAGSDDVALLAAVLDGLPAGPVILMGKSWGGGAALRFACHDPTRVAALILSAPAFRGNLAPLAGAMPTLIVWSEDDPVIPVDAAAHFLEQLPQAELLRYPTGGHSAAMNNVAACAPAVVAFLRRQGLLA